MKDLVYRCLVVLLLVGMKAARWRMRRELGGDAARIARKKNPGDAMLLGACQVAWTIVLGVYVAMPSWIAFGDVGLPAAWRWGGFAVGIAGALLVGWADRCLGNNLSGIVQIKQRQTLITTGPYRWVRHPIYSGGLLHCLGHFLVSANVCVGLCCLGGTILLYAVRIPKEEKMLLDEFGDEYRRYANRTNRLMPRLFRPGQK